MIDVLKLAAGRAGGVPSLAKKIGVSKQALYQWRRVPADKVAALARETGLSERLLRPDLFAGPATSSAYDDDFAAWAESQAGLLKNGQLDQLDIGNLIEEVADLARRDRDEIESRLGVLLMHLLKLRYQPDARSPSWDSTILQQRTRIAKRIARSPSLKTYPAQVLADEYKLARREAALETGLPIERFPEVCPFAIEDVLDLDFMPQPKGDNRPT
jgi:hypothetical protein